MVCLARQQFIARLRLYSVIRRLIVGYELVIARWTGQDRTGQYNTRQDKFELYESCKPLGLQQKGDITLVIGHLNAKIFSSQII